MPIIKEDPLRRYDPDAFSFKSMKGEVSEAMHFDWKRDKIDDCKKRAIYDAKCYDEFKDRVAGCTLKPIHRNEFNAPPKFTFNNSVAGYGTDKPAVLPFNASSQDAASKATARDTSGRGGGGEAAVFAEKVPRNSHEFDRELRRRATSEDKVRLLELVLENGLVAKLFSRELDGEMLRQVLTALEDVLDRGTASSGIARRFFVTLTVECPVSITSVCTFLDSEERNTIARLLARDPGTDPGDDVRVCAAFGVQPSSVAAAAAALPPPAAPLPSSAPLSSSVSENADIAGMD